MQFNNAGICLLNVMQTGPLSAELTVPEGDLSFVHKLTDRCGGELSVRNRRGLLVFAENFASRWMLLLATACLLFLTLWIPSRILFFFVEGNSRISDALILEKAYECGLRFGISRKEIRSEAFKNRLMESLPDLRWAGINTRGCVAVIQVAERGQQVANRSAGAVTSLIADRPGIVEACTVTAGTLLCKPGQAVQAGDILICVLTDCGRVLRAQRAEGTVFAATIRSISLISPENRLMKGLKTVSIKKISLLLGKKRINLSKDSGIYSASCDKMYQEYYMMLPGGFQLPIGIGLEKMVQRDVTVVTPDKEDMENQMLSAAEAYLLEQMIAGRILYRSGQFVRLDSALYYEGMWQCSEMIAREMSEEIIEEYGKNRGENGQR